MDIGNVARHCITLLTLALVWVVASALRAAGGGRPLGRGLWVAFAVVGALAYAPVPPGAIAVVFPLGLAMMVLFAVGLGFVPRVAAVLAALDDGSVRAMLAFRAVFGGVLLALGATGRMPAGFATGAGLGDLAVGLLALAAPAGALTVARRSRFATLVHAVGLVDLALVVSGAATVVLPWAVAHPASPPNLLLPWLAVPLMLSLNVHGLRLSLRTPQSDARVARPEPAARARRAAA